MSYLAFLVLPIFIIKYLEYKNNKEFNRLLDKFERKLKESNKEEDKLILNKFRYLKSNSSQWYFD